MLEWLQNPVVAIALAIGAMFFGYFFGLVEGRGQGEKKRKEEEPETKTVESAPEPLPAAAPVPSDEIPVLNVSTDRAGNLRLKLDGQHIDTSTFNANQRKRLIEVLTQLRPLLESPAAAPPARPKPAPTSKITTPPSGTNAGTMPVAQPSRIGRPAPPSPVRDDDEPVAAPHSIVEQIDSILQAQIAGTPLRERGIRLQESPEGGVIVWVGINKYAGVVEVPDEQIQAAIREAIAIWENRFTPGL